MRNQIENGIFGKLSAEQMGKVKAEVIPDAKIRLCGTLMTPSRDIVPISEALVAYDPVSDTIVKFIAAFIPPHPNAPHQGVKYLVSKDHCGDHKPVVITNNGKADRKQNKGGKKMFWNPHFLTAFLDYSKLPMNVAQAEFRVLRVYRAGLRVKHRFELLAFDTPKVGENVDKKTMRLELPFNSVPPIALARCYKAMFWWQTQILFELSDFSGVDLSVALDLGIKRKLDQAVQTGTMAPEVEEAILHDHSEDPVEGEVSEPLSVSLGINNMVQPEEGKPFYVPDNPLLQTMPEKEYEEEELVDLHD